MFLLTFLTRNRRLLERLGEASAVKLEEKEKEWNEDADVVMTEAR